MFHSTNRWVSLRLDYVCALFTICTIAIAIPMKDAPWSSTELLILSIQTITDVITQFAQTLRMTVEFENYMTCSQRVHQYTKLDLEDELLKKVDKQLEQDNWPAKGTVEFEDVTMHYREGLEPSIKGLNFKAEAGMKVGIVGRTGAGKSSILQALFRLCEITSGKIKIDGQDLKEIGLHGLRKNIAYIPQSPFLLQGSVRENLDPFNELSDDEINKIIEEVQLDEKVKSLEHGLKTQCSESNQLFSVGQK